MGPAGGAFSACRVGTYRSEGHSDCRDCPKFSTTQQAGAPSREACVSQVCVWMGFVSFFSRQCAPLRQYAPLRQCAPELSAFELECHT